MGGATCQTSCSLARRCSRVSVHARARSPAARRSRAREGGRSVSAQGRALSAVRARPRATAPSWPPARRARLRGSPDKQRTRQRGPHRLPVAPCPTEPAILGPGCAHGSAIVSAQEPRRIYMIRRNRRLPPRRNAAISKGRASLSQVLSACNNAASTWNAPLSSKVTEVVLCLDQWRGP